MKNRVWKRVLATVLLTAAAVQPALAYDTAYKNRMTQTISNGWSSYGVVSNDGNMAISGNSLTYGLMQGSALSDIVSFALGSSAGAAILSNNQLWTWGDNEYGQTGHSKEVARYSSPPKKLMENVIQVSMGDVHGLAVKADSTLWAWGSNSSGQLGIGTAVDSIYTPRQIMSNVASAGAGTYGSLAIQNDGSLWVWGSYGASPNFVSLGTKPTKVMDNVTAASIGATAVAAVTKDGQLWMWGKNQYGQLGNGTTVNCASPVRVMSNVTAVSVGNTSCLAIRSDGSLWYWGAGLTDTTAEAQLTPVKLLDNVVACNAAANYSSALLSDGTLYYWGSDYSQAETLSGVALPEKIKTQPSAWAKAELEAARSLDLIPEQLDDQYQEAITRLEFCTLATAMIEAQTGKNILAVVQEQEKTTADVTYTDCSDASVAAIGALGIVSGYGDGRFGPNDNLTREQAAVMLTRTAKVLGMTAPNGTTVTFNDSESISSWAQEGVQFISSCVDGSTRVMSGQGNGNFAPHVTYSREQAMITFKRLYNSIG